MRTVRRIAELRVELGDHHRAGRSIGFVPTMGALHEGHLSLVRAARRTNDIVVVSIFVNPLQFGPGEDFTAYPRNEADDVRTLSNEGTDLVFLPASEEMYPPGGSTTISVGRLALVLEGEHRPGHFDGVCTVVAKLFNIVGSCRAYFGQKDSQQVAVLRRMARDLDFDVAIVTCPTVREHDGIALSSRNAYLSGDDRTRATVLYRALQAGRAELLGGGGIAGAEVQMRSVFDDEGISPDYVAACDPQSFDEPEPEGPVLLAVAARVGPARLIDNFLVTSDEMRGVAGRAVSG